MDLDGGHCESQIMEGPANKRLPMGDFGVLVWCVFYFVLDKFSHIGWPSGRPAPPL